MQLLEFRLQSLYVRYMQSILRSTSYKKQFCWWKAVLLSPPQRDDDGVVMMKMCAKHIIRIKHEMRRFRHYRWLIVVDDVTNHGHGFAALDHRHQLQEAMKVISTKPVEKVQRRLNIRFERRNGCEVQILKYSIMGLVCLAFRIVSAIMTFHHYTIHLFSPKSTQTECAN